MIGHRLIRYVGKTALVSLAFNLRLIYLKLTNVKGVCLKSYQTKPSSVTGCMHLLGVASRARGEGKLEENNVGCELLSIIIPRAYHDL